MNRKLIDKLFFNRIPADKDKVTRYLFYALFVVAILPVVIFRDFTPDNELRYLCIADESLANGNFFAFTNNGVPYADKPPLYLWLVMLCRLICGSHQMWLLSLLSVIPAFVTIWAMNSLCSKQLSQRGLTVASAMLLTTAYFLAMSVTLRMDMLMTMFIVLSIRSFMLLRNSDGNSRRERWLFPIWIFLAVFSKGPIGILVPLLTTIIFCLVVKDRKTLRLAWGFRTWGVLVGLCAAWFFAVYLDGGTEYLDNLLFHQTMGRAVNSFHHSRPVWWYCETIWYVVAPWSIFAVYMLVRALCNFRSLSDVEKISAIAVVSTFVMLSLISGKLQVYLLPLIPFLIYGGWMESMRGGATKWSITTIAFPVILLMAVWPATWFKEDILPAYILESVPVRIVVRFLFWGGLVILRVLLEGNCAKGLRRGTTLLSATILISVFIGAFALPSLRPYIGWRDAAEKVKELEAVNGAGQVVGVGVPRIENMAALLDSKPPRDLQLTSASDVKDSAVRLKKDSLLIRNFSEELTEPVVVVTDKQFFPFFEATNAIRCGNLYILALSPDSKKALTHE